jgi:demethylmenaquinone methyltransferase/2-methoxy-6-polyprenyl-1,4-benzoquinol methylase
MTARLEHRERAIALPDADNKAAVVEDMFDRIAPRYDRLNRLLTFRLDVGWRRRAVADLALAPGSTVIDLACGTGDLCNDVRRAGLAPIGFDFSAGMLAAATTTSPLVRADVLRLPVRDGSVDGITCGFALRNLRALEPFFAACVAALRRGGRIALIDVGEPRSAVVRAGHSLYFRHVVPFIGGLLSDRDAYSYLPASTAYLPPPADLVRLVMAAGFHEVRHTQLGLGAAQLMTATRR